MEQTDVGNSSAMNDSTQDCAQSGIAEARAMGNDAVEGWPARVGRGRKEFSRGHGKGPDDML